MNQVFNYGGNIIIEDIPAPICGDNQVLVGNCYSLISAGTEKSTLNGESNGIISKILKNPLGRAKNCSPKGINHFTTKHQCYQEALKSSRKYTFHHSPA